MKIENEARALMINEEEVLKKIKNRSLQFVSAEFQKRYVYDFNPPVKGKWIRLRTDGKKTTLTIKEILDNSISGTKEIEIYVSDFIKTNEILNELGYLPRSFQENFRIEFKNDVASFDVDFWPEIAPYLEIESTSKELVEEFFKEFGYTLEQITAINVDSIYKDIYGIDLDNIKELKFNDEMRDYLSKIRRKLIYEYTRDESKR